MKGLRGTTSQGAGFRHHAGHKVTQNWTGSVLGVSKSRSTCILALRGAAASQRGVSWRSAVQRHVTTRARGR